MEELSPIQRKTRIYLVVAFFVILIVFLIGMFWLSTAPGQTVGLTLA